MTSRDELTISFPRLDLPAILEKTILAGIIFILALPLLGDYGTWLFPIGKDIIFKLAVEFLLFMLLLKMVLYNPSRPPLTLRGGVIVLPLFAFWLIMALSATFSVQPDFSLWGNIYKNQGLMTWTHYILFFVLLVGFLHDKKHWQVLINIAIFSATLVGLIALWQVLASNFDSRAASTLNNSNYLAAYLVLLLPITFAFFLRNKSFFLGSAALLQFLALIATQTRGGYLGIAVAALIFFILYLARIKQIRKRKLFLWVCPPVLLLIACYLLLIFSNPGHSFQKKLPNFTDRFLNRQNILADSGPRFEAWRAGWQGMIARPILGYGPENFFVAFDERYSGSQDSNGSLAEEGTLWESWFDKAHNFIFDIGATTGFLGLFAYIAVFTSAIYMLFRKLGIVKIGLISAFVGYIAQNLLGFDTIVPGIYLMFLLGYSHFLTTKNFGGNSAADTPPSNPPLSKGGKWGGAMLLSPPIVILAFLFIASFKIHTDILRANHQLNLAETLAQRGQIEQSFAAFENGLKYNASPINPNLRRRYAVIALSYYDAIEKLCNQTTSESSFAKDSEGGKKCKWLFADSEKYLSRALVLQQENAAAEWPYFTRNYIYAAQISHILRDYENSDMFFEKALELSPNRTSINTEWNRLREKRKGRASDDPAD